MVCRLILFDLGGVLVEHETDRLILQVSQQLGQPFDDVLDVVYDKAWLLPLEVGAITPEQYFTHLKNTLELPWDYEQFVVSWNGMLGEKTDLARVIARLARRQRLMALTNTNVLHLQHMKSNFQSLDVLSDWVASCEVGCRKPEPEIYQLALKRAGVPADSAAYVDDRPEMVKAGQAAGLTAIRFESQPQLERDLRSAGVLLE